MLLVVVILVAAVLAVLSYLFRIRSFEDVQDALTRVANGQSLPQALCRVEEKSINHGGMLVADVLKAHGVEHLFTLVGGHISPILVACEKIGIKVIDTRHEVTAVFAADAVARLKQSIGVATVTAGPGLTNTVTAIKNAQMAESPVLLMGGAAATLLKGRGALQDIDQMALFRPLCKYCATITRISDIVPTLKEAIRAARSGTPGPVFVEFPIDTLYPYITIHKELGVQSSAKGFLQKIINFYLETHISRLFSGAWVKQDCSPLQPDVPMPTPEQIRQSCQMLKNAKKPVMLIGSQASLPPVPIEMLKKAVEDLGIPVYLGGMARGLLGGGSKQHIRQNRKQALRDADLVIMAGAIADFRLSYGRVLNRRSQIICVNRNKSQLFKNSDMFWKPTLPVQADVGSFVVQLAESIKREAPTWKSNPEWLQTLVDRNDETEARNRKKAEEKPDQHLNPVDFLLKLDHILPDDVILVADGGDFVGTAAYTLRARGALRWLDPGAFGTLGVGGGFALGAALVCPDKPVVILYGDGSLGYSLIEYDTYKRHKVGVISIVGNDACWSQIAREQVPMLGSAVACNLEYSDYGLAVSAFGAHHATVDTDNIDQLQHIINECLTRVRSPDRQASLVNVLIGKSSFREGSISV